VPLQAVTPCATSPIGCEPAWLADVATIETGVRTGPFRLSAPGDVFVARIAIPAGAFAPGAPNPLRISLQEAAGRHLAAHLQCGGRSLTYTTDQQATAAREFLSNDCLLSVRPAGSTRIAQFSVLVERATP
jgi:hypothetical protein